MLVPLDAPRRRPARRAVACGLVAGLLAVAACGFVSRRRPSSSSPLALGEARRESAALAGDEPEVRSYLVQSWNLTFAPNNTCCATLSLELARAYFTGSHADANGKDAVYVALEYRVKHANSSWLWTPAVKVSWESDWLAAIQFCRLRLNAEHEVYVWLKAAGGAKTAALQHSFRTRALGFAHYDDGPFANVTRVTDRPDVSAPSFDLLTFQSVSAVGNIYKNGRVFFGLVTVDADGYIVWYHEMPYHAGWGTQETAYSVYEWVPDSFNVVVMRAVKNYQSLTPPVNSYLYEITPAGEVVHSYDAACTGMDATAFNQFSHECRVDTSVSSFPILTFTRTVRSNWGDWRSLSALDSSLADEYRGKNGNGTVPFLSEKLVVWQRENNTLVEELDLFDYINPTDDALEGSAYALTDFGCGDADSMIYGLDWTHASSAAAGNSGNFLISLRNLNAILSFRRDSEGGKHKVQWVIASELDFGATHGYQQFALEREKDRFYQVRAAARPASARARAYAALALPRPPPTPSRARAAALGHADGRRQRVADRRRQHAAQLHSRRLGHQLLLARSRVRACLRAIASRLHLTRSRLSALGTGTSSIGNR